MKTRTRLYLVFLLFLFIVPMSFSLEGFLPSRLQKTTTPSNTIVAAQQSGFAPNPSLFFNNGSSWTYSIGFSESDVTGGTSSKAFAGLTYEKDVLLWGGTSNQYSYRDTIVALNASDSSSQEQIGVKQTTSNSQAIPSEGLGDTLNDSALFVTSLIPNKPETSDIVPVLPSIAFVLRSIPPTGTRTYTGDQMGITSTYNVGVTGSETISVALDQSKAFPTLGTLKVASISAFSDVQYSGVSAYACPTMTESASGTEVLHMQFLEIVDMSTGLVLSRELSAQYQLNSPECPTLNEDLTYSNDVVLTSWTLAPPSSGVINVYPTQANFTSIQLDYSAYTLSSPIHVEVVQDSELPSFLVASFREHGAKSAFSPNTIELSPSSTGKTLLDVNITIDCSSSGCSNNGVSLLPVNYTLQITASSGEYSQQSAIPLQLLKAKWLVMLYSEMDTIAPLESTMLYNVQEMINVSKNIGNPGVGMLVLMDLLYGAPGSYQQGQYSQSTNLPTQDVWGISSLPAQTTQLYQVVNGSLTKKGADWDSSDYLSSAVTLHKFITTAMSMIPADHNQLILSDHGGGMTGLEFDQRNNGAGMYVSTLAQTLSDITPKLDVLSFDACLMAQIEVLYQLKDYATYITASERTVPGYGYAYNVFLYLLNQDPAIDPAFYVTGIVNSYEQRYAGSFATENATLFAIDTSKIGAVESSADALASALNQQYSSGDPQFNNSMSSIVLSCWRADYGFPYTDLSDLANKIASSTTITDQATVSAAKAVSKSVADAVIESAVDYSENGVPVKTGYNGISVFLFNVTNVPSDMYQSYSGWYAYTSFSSDAASWSTFDHNFNVSQPASAASSTVVSLNHPGHELYLNIYDSLGRHVGLNPSLMLQSREQTEIGIPGAMYFDYHNGTTIILLPGNVGNFKVMVDGGLMKEASEAFTITYNVVTNGTLTSKTVSGQIEQNTAMTSETTIQNGEISVGDFVSTTYTETSGGGTGVETATGNSSSSSSVGGLDIGTISVAVVIVVILVLASLLMMRRNRAKQRNTSTVQQQRSWQNYPTVQNSNPAQPQMPAYFCPNCGNRLVYYPNDRIWYCSKCRSSQRV